MRAGAVIITPCDSSGTWLVALQGDHDLSTRALLQAQTASIWPLCTAAVVDLSETTFIDSGVIRWLLSVGIELEAMGPFALRVVEGGPGSVADRMFHLLRMRYVLPCYATREDALAQAPALTRPKGLPLRRAGSHHATAAWRIAA